MRERRLAAVLFDLDGTLIDSAPDLAGAANEMRVARGLALLPLAHYRPMVGTGARGMLGQALGVGPDDPDFIALRDEFLARYEQRMAQETRVFDGMLEVIEGLQAGCIPWGIVTNKATRYAQISYQEALLKRLKVMDSTAFSLCQDNKMPIIVFDLFKPHNLRKVVMGAKVGTLVTG